MECSQLQNLKIGQEGKVEESEFIVCYICDIQVPTVFINSHYKSEKHKINTNIAIIAMERIKKSLLCNVISSINNNGLYFCPNCVISIDIKESESHKKSYMHKNAVMADKILKDFYVVYANDTSDTATSMETPMDSFKLMSQLKSNYENKINITLNKDGPSSNGPSTSFANNKPAQNGEMKIKGNEVIVKENKSIATTSGNFKGEIKPTRGVTDTDQSVSNQSPFCVIDDRQLFCKICKVYVPNKQKNILSHERGNQHRCYLKITNYKHF